jgi:hypothetical protein
MTDTLHAAARPTPAIAGTAVVAGVVAAGCGLAFALSPLGTVALALLLWMCHRTAQTLDAADRTWFWSMVGAGIALRFAVVAALFVLAPLAGRHVLTLAPDAEYLIDRTAILRNLWAGVPLGPHQFREIFNPYGASSYVVTLAVLQRMFGPAPNAIALVSAICHVAASLVIFQELRRHVGVPAARMALGLLLFWPTLFVWSVSVLRESAQFLLITLSLIGASRAVTSARWTPRLAWAVAGGCALALLGTLRAGSLPIALGGLSLAAAGSLLLHRRALLIAVIALAVIAGWRAQDRIVGQVRLAASRHFGHVMSAGVSYRLLPPRFYSGGDPAIAKMDAADSVRYLAAATVMFAAAPAPSQMASASSAALLPQQLAWYAVLVAAVLGLGAGLRRHRWLTLLLAGYVVAGVIIIAPNSGNIGTLVRHRDMIVPFVIALAAPVLAAAASGLARMRPPA